MFIKIKRTQNCTSGSYRSGVTYEIDAKNPFQVRDAETMIKRGFAEKVDAPKAEKKAVKKAVKKTVKKADVEQVDKKAEAEAAAVEKAEVEKAAVEAAALKAQNAKSED